MVMGHLDIGDGTFVIDEGGVRSGNALLLEPDLRDESGRLRVQQRFNTGQ